MITSLQIRRARELLGINPSTLALRAKLTTATVRRAESVDKASITIEQEKAIRRALEPAGIEFT